MSARGLYVGRGGQMVVMAEFLVRGYNVAIPEVDRGDDIFVVQDNNGTLSRVQVKTATLREFGAVNERSEGQRRDEAPPRLRAALPAQEEERLNNVMA